jgi:hypothetical protein
MPRNGNGYERPPLGPGSRGPAQGAFDFLGDVQTSDEPISLLPCSPELLRDAVAKWVERGHAVTIGRTSDGGAIGVHLLANGQKHSQYFSEIATLEDFLSRLANAPIPPKGALG